MKLEYEGRNDRAVIIYATTNYVYTLVNYMMHGDYLTGHEYENSLCGLIYKGEKVHVNLRVAGKVVEIPLEELNVRYEHITSAQKARDAKEAERQAALKAQTEMAKKVVDQMDADEARKGE